VLSRKDWIEQLEVLKISLRRDEADVKDEKSAYTVGYNSPYTPADMRTNEVWLEAAEISQNNDDNDDDDVETLTPVSIKSYGEYELREYAASLWACTLEESVATGDTDFMAGWREKFGDDPWKAMKARRKYRKEKGEKSAFKKLYAYIAGVNSETEEIDMSAPVLRQHTPTGVNEETAETCFWLANMEREQAPEPLKKDVYLKRLPAMSVYARRFGGWAMSWNDWDTERKKLAASAGLEDKAGVFITAGYDSPWQREDRRNEVWIVKS